MSRLIDADALMVLVQKTHCTECNNYNKVKCRACAIGDMLDYLDDAPTVDRWHYPSKGEYPKIGEKVFCKDCIGEYNVAEYQGNSVDGEPPWLFNDKIDDYVRAWQYFIPPEE